MNSTTNERAQKEPKIIKKLPSPTDLLCSAWEIYTKKLGILLAIAAIPAVIAFLFRILSTGSYLGIQLFPQGLSFAASDLIMSVLIIIIILVPFWSNIALMYAVKDAGNISLKEAYNKAIKITFPFLWLAILTSIIICGGMFPLIIPGIIIAVWLTFNAWILIDENERGLKALLKSKMYVQGYGWAIFVRMLFLLLIFFVIYIPLLIIVSFLVVGKPHQDLQTLFSVFFSPIALLYGYELFKSVKAVKSGENLSASPKTKKRFIILAVWGVCAVCLVIAVTVIGVINGVSGLS